MALSIYYGSSISNQREKLQDQIIWESIQHPENQYIVLVPEQASLSVQEEFVKKHPQKALSNIDVLTFNRLCYRVFQDTHQQEKTFVSENGKLMMIRLLVSKLEDNLGILKRSIHHEGFIKELKSVFSEFAQYNISPEMVKESAGKIENNVVLKEKMQDIALLYEGFLQKVHEKYALSEERIAHLGSSFSKWDKASKTIMMLDGFTGFTPPQYEAIEAFFQSCKDIYLGVVLGSNTSFEKEKEEDDLFFMSAQMVTHFKEIAIRQQVPYDFVLADEGTPSKEMVHIERNLFRENPLKYEHEINHFQIVKAADEETEVRLVLHEIMESIRKDHLSFKEMAVICGDPEEYASYIQRAFDEAKIPYFLDVSRKILNNPLPLFIEELRDVLLKNFDFDSVFHLAKNPLFLSFAEAQLQEPDELDVFERISETENYVKAIGVRGVYGYEKPWTYEYRHFDSARIEQINEVREKVFGPFTQFYQAFKGEDVTQNRIEELRDFLEKIEVPQTISKMILDDSLEVETKKEYEATFTFFHDILEEVAGIFGQELTTVEEFFEILLAGMEEEKIGIAPPTKDRVVIGDVKRTRLSSVKRLFIIGANEGRFPNIGSSAGLLTDSDREELSKNALVLSETSRQEIFQMQFYLYLLLTKPEEFLMITYANADRNGKMMAPAGVLSQVKNLFEELRIENRGFARNIQNTKNGYLKDFSVQLHDKHSSLPEGLRKTYAWGMEHEEIRNRILQMKDQYEFMYQAVSLNQETARNLYGNQITGSVSRLETFSKCPYSHFFQYGLQLREQEVHGIKNNDMGTMFHDAINRFFQILKEEKISLREISISQQNRFVQRALDDVVSKNQNFILKENKRNEYLIERASRVVNRTVSALQDQLKMGSFDQIETEVSFGRSSDRDRMQTALEAGVVLSLEGRIDRIDTYDDGNQVFVRIIDYKSSDHHLNATQIYNGLQLQLLLYLLAALKRNQNKYGKKKIVPAGIYYYTIQDPIIDQAQNKKEPEIALKEALRMKGITESSKGSLMVQEEGFSTDADYQSSSVVGLRTTKKGELYKTASVLTSEQLEKLTDFAFHKAKEIGDCIASGEIMAQPVKLRDIDGCAYCAYKTICGYGNQIPGYGKRNIVEKKDIKEIAEDNGYEME